MLEKFEEYRIENPKVIYGGSDNGHTHDSCTQECSTEPCNDNTNGGVNYRPGNEVMGI